MMKFPDFDNIDLAIGCITLIAIAGLVCFIAKGIDLAIVVGFAGTCVSGICGLAKGKQNGNGS